MRWGAPLEVPVTTLDALIERHGLPRFCKIDVEGFEAEILRGLSQPIPLLSLEYVPAAIGIACEAVALLAALGSYRFNATVGERRSFPWPDWQEPAAALAWLRARRPDERSGDVYARLEFERHLVIVERPLAHEPHPLGHDAIDQQLRVVDAAEIVPQQRVVGPDLSSRARSVTTSARPEIRTWSCSALR